MYNISMLNRYLVILLFSLVLTPCASSQVKEVSEVKAEVEEIGEDSFGTNINYGILYLMAAPYILLLIFFRKRIKGLFKALLEKK